MEEDDGYGDEEFDDYDDDDDFEDEDEDEEGDSQASVCVLRGLREQANLAAGLTTGMLAIAT